MQGRDRDTCREKMWTQQVIERDGQTESVYDIYALSCVQGRASGEVLYNRGSSDCCSMTTWRTEMGVASRMLMEGIYAYLELLHTVVQQKLTHYKAILLQIKFFINSLLI